MNERRRRGDLPDDRHPLLHLVSRQQPIEVNANRSGPACPPGQPSLRGLVDGEHRTLGGQQQDLVLTGIEQGAPAEFAVP
jgi:hypothetical protein